MKNISDLPAETPQVTPPSGEREVFTATLSNGRVVKVREMLGSHFLYMETALKKHASMKKMYFMVTRLSEGTGAEISLEEIEALRAKDIKKISELFSRAAGEDPDDEEETSDSDEDMEFPN